MTKGKPVKKFNLKAKLWLYPGDTAAWHFLTVDKKTSTQIKSLATGPRRGFGSVPVRVSIGKVVWETSIFPDAKSGCYFLPVKAKVRREVGLEEGDTVKLSLELR